MKKDISEISGPELQTELAIMRTALALDRTLLAWIRTSLTFIGFGFTLAKFIGELTKAGQLNGVPIKGIDSPRTLGLTMMTLGLIGLIGAAVDHWRAEKRLTSKALTISPWSVSFLIAVLLVGLTIALMAVLAFETQHEYPLKEPINNTTDQIHKTQTQHTADETRNEIQPNNK